MIETIELKTEKYLDDRFDILSKRKIKLEEHIKEGRTEITELENQIQELNDSVDESYDVFQAKSSEENFLEDEKKSLEDRMEVLFNRNTDDIVEVKEIEQEIFAINDAKTELSSIKKKIVVNDLEKDEASNEGQKENDTNENSVEEKKDEIIEENKEKESVKNENGYVLSKEDTKIIIERLKLAKSLAGKDNQRVIMTLTKMIEEFEKLN